jgi:phosphopantothenoylcysteine decarboxylase/phosphopantothenate--cysteine ligase
MRILITAGPTREYIDRVRFISNASSGRMGYAVATTALAAGHEVTLLAGPTALKKSPAGVKVVHFISVAELRAALDEHFDACDALVMAAAVGDFTVANPSETKLSRKAGPVTLTLQPTEDLLAGLSQRKRPGQIVVAFAVEVGRREEIERKARRELAEKGADLTVVNTPDAMAADKSTACILTAEGTLLPWATRTKKQLADEILAVLTEKTGDFK